MKALIFSLSAHACLPWLIVWACVMAIVNILMYTPIMLVIFIASLFNVKEEELSLFDLV